MLLILNTNGPGITVETFNGVNAQHCANALALTRLLIDKGIVTPGEWQAYHVRALSDVDQAFAEHRDDCLRSYGMLPTETDNAQ